MFRYVRTLLAFNILKRFTHLIFEKVLNVKLLKWLGHLKNINRGPLPRVRPQDPISPIYMVSTDMKCVFPYE